jgi:hypothetical protein
MRMPLLVAACAVSLAGAASALLAAPGQTQQPGQTTQQPGQMTQARVWIQNRGHDEAIPINLQEVSLEAPLRVRVVNAQPAPGRDEPVNVHIVRQPRVWQYQSVTVAAGENIAAALSVHGAGGWETTGIASTTRDATTLLMKRLR